MGRFQYEDSVRVDFDDRVLAHLQTVMGMKLRRSESFYFTWRESVDLGGGRTSVWIHSRAGLVFKFHGSRMPRLNRTWLDALMQTANSPGGLQIIPEPAENGDASPDI
ncbi:ATP-dependent DNA ligase [Microbacterium sp. B2969]|uniref:ATP-dependent DNA ligase n=1 Tax=Microbacterium alkaliflavum TaxID=3248839 RepID=A0ABW7QAF0_9MICO